MSMKIHRIIQNLFTKQPEEIKKAACPIVYDRNNVTAAEFKKYIHWLAENGINKTFKEPDRFVSEAERKSSQEYQNFVGYLAINNINKTFRG